MSELLDKLRAMITDWKVWLIALIGVGAEYAFNIIDILKGFFG